MTRTRVKICGITRTEDALAAASAGVDALGFVFYGPSPRNVDVIAARDIINRLPVFVTTVGLFVNASADFVQERIDACGLDLLQFHGDESPAFCEGFGRPYFKALRMRSGMNVEAESQRYKTARALLLDSFHPAKPGGTGERFDWQRVPQNLATPIVLAGGLTPENVAAAISTCSPWAVDVSGGVESTPGQKCPQKMQKFITAASAPHSWSEQ